MQDDQHESESQEIQEYEQQLNHMVEHFHQQMRQATLTLINKLRLKKITSRFVVPKKLSIQIPTTSQILDNLAFMDSPDVHPPTQTQYQYADDPMSPSLLMMYPDMPEPMDPAKQTQMPVPEPGPTQPIILIHDTFNL